MGHQHGPAHTYSAGTRVGHNAHTRTRARSRTGTRVGHNAHTRTEKRTKRRSRRSGIVVSHCGGRRAIGRRPAANPSGMENGPSTPEASCRHRHRRGTTDSSRSAPPRVRQTPPLPPPPVPPLIRGATRT